jgi:hypothetical protein
MIGPGKSLLDKSGSWRRRRRAQGEHDSTLREVWSLVYPLGLLMNRVSLTFQHVSNDGDEMAERQIDSAEGTW